MKYFETVDIISASDNELIKISKEGLLALSLEEMRKIKEYFKTKKRNPTDIELETIAQTWSEHCKHKTLTASCILKYKNNNKTKILKFENLLKETIFEATQKIKHKDCLSVFEDNAGVINFDKDYAISFKVETHNHPSALEPYGGASTGIGGVIRDIIGCGLAAKPIANTDVFCFGNIRSRAIDSEKIHHPKRIFRGVVEGVRDYGNRMGIPTVNGAIIFDDGYKYNPLVFCGCVGIIPKDKIKKTVNKGDVIIVVGGKTGRDGIHGATFSSDALHDKLPTSVVQIGDAVTEKMFLDVILEARDKNLFNAITDCGAGGLSSACGELTKENGCKIFLEKVPIKYKGLKPWEIWLSESQERMVVITSKNKASEFIETCNKQDVEATIIGEVTDSKNLEIFYEDKKICQIDMDFLHEGIPKIKINVTYSKKNIFKRINKISLKHNKIENLIIKVLSHPNVCSKEAVIRNYDHEVQANTILKPLIGNHSKNIYSPQDASVIKPIEESTKAVAISCGIKPLLSKYDIEAMTAAAIDEAIRNLICVGANFNKIFLLDNFCWGNIKAKNEIANLILSCQTAKNVSLYFKTPFISGKDSLNNYYQKNNKKISIPETLLISSLGVIDNISETLSTDFKKENNLIYLIGSFKEELIGSVFSEIFNYHNKNIISMDIKKAKTIYENFGKIRPFILSAHDISDGGIITTLLEMSFANNIGFEIDLSNFNSKNIIGILFSEPNSCILVEVMKNKKEHFEYILKRNKIPYAFIGKTIGSPIGFVNMKQNNIVKLSIETMYLHWSNSIKLYEN